MKISTTFAIAASTILFGACGQFSEISLDVQTLDVEKQLDLVRLGTGHAATIQEITYTFENGLLIGDKVESELFADEAITLDFGTELDNILDKEIFEADELYDDFEFTLQAVEIVITADFDDDGVEETNLEVTLEDVNETFEFAELGVNSVGQNIAAVLEFNPQNIFDGIDFNNAVPVVGVDTAIDADNTPDEIDIIADNVVDPAKAFVAFVYNVQGQVEKVRP